MAFLLLLLLLACVVYELFWQMVSHRKGVRLRWIGRSRAEQRLRQGWPGFGRLLIAWTLVLIVYCIGISGTDSLGASSSPRDWRVEADEWILIGILAPILAAAEQFLAGRSFCSSRVQESASHTASVVLSRTIEVQR